MSPAQIFESGVIGGIYGLAFTGGGRFVQKMRRNKKNELSLSEVQLSSANKEPKEKMQTLLMMLILLLVLLLVM